MPPPPLVFGAQKKPGLDRVNVVGSVGTLPAVCDTFCLWIDPAVGR